MLTVAGDNGIPGTTASVTLDAQGRGTYRLQSTGALPAGKAIVMPIGLAYDPGWWSIFFPGPPTPIASFNVALQPAEQIGRTLDYIGKLGWSILTGPGDSPDAIAADMAFSFIPVVGVYSDIRDAASELLKLWPGGEGPNWLAFGLAAAGIAAEFTPADLIFDVAKALARQVQPSGVLIKTFVAKINEAASEGIGTLSQKLSGYADQLGSILGLPGYDPTPQIAGWSGTFVQYFDKFLVQNADDLDNLQALSQKMDGFNDFVAGIASKFSPEEVRRAEEAFEELSTAQLSAIQDAGRLGEFSGAVARGEWTGETLRRNANELISGLPSDLISAAASARQPIAAGGMHDFVPPAGSGRNSGHARSKHGIQVNDPLVVDIRNNPDKIYVGVNDDGNKVVVFFKDDTVVITDAADTTAVITVFGKNVPGRAGSPPKSRTDIWANNPQYYLVE